MRVDQLIDRLKDISAVDADVRVEIGRCSVPLRRVYVQSGLVFLSTEEDGHELKAD
jgi:hypothetical protein